jgi:molybdopterin-guanine dinucleotide biosynthesis protein A
MGQPKALLPFDGVPLIVHIVETLSALFPEVVVVAAPGQDLPSMPVTLVHDEVAHQGPVGGIYYGLAAAAGEVSFVTSCDSVFLNPALIRHVVSRIADHDVAVPWWDGRLQPLHAAYRRSVLPYLDEQLERGDLRPVHLFEKVRTRRIDEAEIRGIDPEGWTFFNMNTPEDYEAALSRWAHVRASHGTVADERGHCIVELFGVARLISHTREVALELPAHATISHVVAALAERLPILVGRVISHDRTGLMAGYACSVDGVGIVRSTETGIEPGARILLLAADAGG